MAQMNLEPVEAYLPHRPPMVLVDRLLEADDSCCTCELTIQKQSPFCGEDGTPAFVGIEYMAQTIAAFDGFHRLHSGEAVKVGLLLGTPKMVVHQPCFEIGRTFQIYVKRVWGELQLARFSCKITEHPSGVLYQEAEINVFLPPDLQNILPGGSKTEGGVSTSA